MMSFKSTALSFIVLFGAIFSSILMPASLENIQIMTEEYPPYNYLGDNGMVTGIAVDTLVAAYKQAGITLNLEQIEIKPWPRAYRQLQASNQHMLFSMTRTPSRERLFKWVGPISKTKITLIAKKSSHIKILTAQDLKGYIIGGILDDIGVQLVRDLINFDANILTTPHAKSLARMLDLNRIDLWAYEENTAKYFFERNNLNADLYESVYTLSEAELFFAFGLKTEDKIIERLQRALDEIKGQ